MYGTHLFDDESRDSGARERDEPVTLGDTGSVVYNPRSRHRRERRKELPEVLVGRGQGKPTDKNSIMNDGSELRRVRRRQRVVRVIIGRIQQRLQLLVRVGALSGIRSVLFDHVSAARRFTPDIPFNAALHCYKRLKTSLTCSLVY